MKPRVRVEVQRRGKKKGVFCTATAVALLRADAL